MERISYDYLRRSIIFMLIITVWFSATVLGRGGNHAVLFFSNFSMDDRATSILTSTEYRFPERFAKTMSEYIQFGELYQEEKSTAIPGLAYTNLGDSSSVQMVPQGICLAEDYMLITAYDNRQVENSVIYVLSNVEDVERSLLLTIKLPDQNHVGGITFDGENIWIAKSSSGKLSRISIDAVEEMVASGDEVCQLGQYEEEVYCGVTASFVTYYGGYIWVGTFCNPVNGKGTISCFCPVQTAQGTQLSLKQRLDVPTYAQGVSFVEKDSKTYMVLSTSYGRYRDSEIYVYELLSRAGEIMMFLKNEYNFPPMAEEIVSDGEHLYVLFESAATCYSTSIYMKCQHPVDRVCAMSIEGLLQ